MKSNVIWVLILMFCLVAGQANRLNAAGLLWRLDFEDNLLDTSGSSTEGPKGAKPFDARVRGAGIQGFVDGRVGRAVEFDGSATNIAVPGTSGPLYEWTATAWFNVPSIGGTNATIVSTDIWIGKEDLDANDVMIDLMETGVYIVLPGGTFYEGNNYDITELFDANDANTWIHIAVSYKVGGSALLYINGVPKDYFMTSSWQAPAHWDTGAGIGGWLYNSDIISHLVVDGTIIDDVRLYDTQLSGSDILAIANTPPYVATITETNESTQVEELGATTDTFTIVLDSQPTDDVVVSLSKTVNGTDFTLSDATLTFTPADWNSPQTVTVQAVDDGTAERLELGFIQFDLSSTDLNFDGASVRDLRVDIVDDDAKEVRVTQSDDDTTVLEGGYTDDLTVSLTQAPTHDVVVTLADGSDPNLIQTDPNVLTFTPADWAAKIVTVTAMDDDVLEDDPHTASISFTVTSGDSGYNDVDVPIVYVDILENECGAWSFSSLDLNYDCDVNLEDYALFALGWLNCSFPNVEGCADYR